MSFYPQKIYRVGSQELYDLGDRTRFTIHKVLLRKGYKFTFSLRQRLLEVAQSLHKPLEVVFEQFPDLSYVMQPTKWILIGKYTKEVKAIPGQPMALQYYFVDFQGNLTKLKKSLAQDNLF